MGKRILSLLLAVVMVAGMIPATAIPTFAAETSTVLEANIASAVTVDGAMNEPAYMQAMPISGGENTPSGRIYATWMNDTLYLAVPFVNAKVLTVTIGEKTFSLDLNAKTLSGAPAGVVAEIGDDVAELQIPLDAVGVELTDYNQEVSFNAALTNDNGTASVAEDAVNLRFNGIKVSAEVATIRPNGGESGISNVGTNEVTFANTTGARQYLFKDNIADIDLNKDFYYQITLTVADMEATDSKTHDWYNGRAFYFWISDEYRIVPSISSSTKTANAVLCDLYDHSTNGLTLRVRQHRTDMTKYVDVVLNRFDNGTAFTLGLKYNGSAKSVDVYVDGSLIQTVPNAMCEEIAYTLGNAAALNLACKGTVTAKNLSVAVPETFTLAGEITAAKVLEGMSLTNLKENVVLPATYTSANLGKLELTWKSSDTNVISDAGVISQSGTIGNAKLTASVNGKALFSADVSVAAQEGAVDEPVIATGTYDAFVASDITVDGAMNELAWRAGSALGGGQPFDILWDGGNLYFAVQAGAEDTAMEVKIGDEVIASATKASGASAIEAQVEYTTKGVATLEDVTITVGKSVWTGDVNLLKYTRVYKPNYSTNSQACIYYDSTAVDGNLAQVIDGDSITMSNEYMEGKKNYKNGRVYNMNIQGFGYANSRAGDIVIEFDFIADKLPATTVGNIGTMFSNYGFTGTIGDANKDGIHYGILKSSGDGKLWLAIAWDTVDSGATSAQKFAKFVALDKVEDEQFAVRLVWTLENNVNVYVDGVLKGTVENCLHKNTLGADTFGFNLWSEGNSMAADGSKDIKFTVSDARVAKAVSVTYEGDAPFYNANVTSTTVTLDGVLDEVMWGKPTEMPFVSGTGVSGSAFMTWGKGILNVAAMYSGATQLELALGEKSWTIDLTAADIATADGIVTGKNASGVVELKIDMLKAGVEILDYNQVEKFQVKLVGETGSAALGEEYANLVFSEFDAGRFTIVSGSNNTGTVVDNRTEKFAGSGRKYMLLSSSYVKHAYDIYLKQTITVNAMPGATGAVNSGHDASGLSIGIFDTKSVSSAIVVYAKGEDIYVRVGKASSQYEEFDTGKNLGETFELGYLWSADDTVKIYVDKVLVGTAEKATYAVNWGAGTYVLNMPTSLSDYEVIVKDITHTVFMDRTAPENTTEKVLGTINTGAVTVDLPARYEYGHFAYNVTWESDNEDVIAANGTVTRPEMDDAVVNVAAVVGGKTLGTVALTVPANTPAEMQDGVFASAFVDAEPTADSNIWNYAAWEKFGSGSGKVAALVYNQKVYLAVDADGAVSATLGEETKTAAAAGMTVLVFDTAVTAYGQELALTVSLDGTTAWESGKLTVAGKVLNKGNKMPTNDLVHSWVKINGDTFTFDTKASVSNSNCAYIIQRKDLTDLANINSDVLFEQDITVESMAYADATGTFYGGAVNNNGFTIMMEYGVSSSVSKTYSAVLVPDADGNLRFVAYTADTSTASVALGKRIGDTFKLSLLWGADGSTTVYVDGAQKGIIENAACTTKVYSGGAGTVNMLLKYQDAACSAEQPAKIVTSRPTLTTLGSQTELSAVETEITQAAIFGDLNLSKVKENLPLNATFRTAYLGDVALRWTSSNESVVKADGTVITSPTKEGSATLSVYLADAEEPLWSVDVIVPQAADSLNALLSEESVSVDGKLSELAWLDWMQFEGVDGNIAAAWTKGNLYLAVYSKDAESLVMTINGKNITVDLANATVSGAANATAKKSASGVVEIGIPLTDINFNLTDYNQLVAFTAKLVDGENEGTLKAEYLNFSGDVAELQPMANFTKDNGPWTLLTNSIDYKGTNPGKVTYVFKTENNIDHAELFVISNEFYFDKLPISDGAFTEGATQGNGFYFYYGDEDPDSRNGKTVAGCIFTEDGTNLKLRISAGKGVEGTVIDLGKTVGEKFRITQYWYPNDDLVLYLDGMLLATVQNATLSTSYLGVDVITFRYYSADTTNDKVEFTLSNWTKLVTKYETVLDELTQNAVFGRVDLDHVQKDLPMVTTFASANFAALNLKWTSSDPSVVAVDGKITRHATEAKTSTVTVYFVGEDEEIKLWSVDVTVDPMSVTKQPAPAVIHTGFTAPGSITLDNALNVEETWLLNGWILDADGQPVGYFGTQWDQNNLYVALHTEAESVTLTINGKLFNVSMTGNVTEVKFSMADLGLDKLTAYGKTMPIVVSMDGASYEGTLKLTNVGWWATDNIFAGLPMLANNVKSITMGTADAPDGNQGAKQLENGWRLYDIYGGEDAANPAGIRTYVLFMKMPVYENFADRSEATHIEFDFHAKALPVWEWDEGAKDEINRAFANYGVTFSMSDKADSAKNSNVAVFGIVNTAEGLVMVVNRGKGIEAHEKFVLNKQVGEEFRIGMTWMTNSNLVLSIDGVEITTINDMSKWVNSVGDTSFVVNMIRNKTKPTSAADNMEVYLTNIGFGKAHSTEDIIRNLTLEDILGENESENEVTTDLVLPQFMTNGQLDHQYPITWEVSDKAVVDPATGEVTRPASGVKFVTLTATLDNNGTTETKSFSLIVLGESVENGSALVVTEDVNPFKGAGVAHTGLLFNLDKTNNSVIYAFSEGEEEQINLVTLTDLDAFSRLNRRSLRLFYSDDNANYTEIEDYKLHHDGCNWYLYDFSVEARYIKVHFSHRDYDATDFFNAPGEMIHVSYDASLVVPEDAKEVAVPATTVLDQAVAIELPQGITTEGLRVALNGELLFHYVDNGTVYVRIANPTSGMLKVWNAEGIELADKENVYEVTYGTTETLPEGARWILGLKAGQTFPNGSKLEVDTLYSMSGKSVSISTNGGYTWETIGSISFSDGGLSSGGWGIDSKTGRLFHEHYDSNPTFVGSDFASSKCVTYVHYSDDGGKTWTRAEGLGKIEDDPYTTYVLSYTDITELKTVYKDGAIVRGNDGIGPNVDFVFPMGAQYNNNGAFCGRVAYTCDGGLTWNYSASVITYGNETAFEGGVSEATILEREDGTLVYYARCQSSTVDNFTISYSLDHGVTWLTPGATSSIYTTNTQALMMTYDFDGFDGNRLTGAPIFMWGGNNVLGGNSYQRMPLNFAVSTNGMDTFRHIQNIFFGTFQDVYTNEADHYITNPSIQQINGDDMYLAYSRLYHKDSVYTVVNNFTDWFVRTKGAYDSFEKASAMGEGWRYTKGTIETTSALASEGSYSMLVKENTQATRSVPYLQNGKLSIDLYVDASSNFVFELQPAYAVQQMKCAVISIQVNGTTATVHDGTTLTLTEGWNTLTFDLALTENKASVSVNGGAAKAIAVNEQFNGTEKHALGNYITYATILATSNVYVDEFFVESSLDAVLEATAADKAAANAVIEQIKSLTNQSTEEEVQVVINAYNALNQVAKDLVNRRVPVVAPNEQEGNANDEGALINYYEELLVAQELANARLRQISISLKDDIGVNYYMELDPAVAEDENAYMQFIYNGETIKVPLSEAVNKGALDNGKKSFVFSFKVPAKEMADEILAQFFYGDGQSTKEKSYCAKDYAEAVINSEDEDLQKYRDVAIAMLNYGAYAQTHFNYNTENPANAMIPAADKEAYQALFAAVEAAELEEYKRTGFATGKAVTLYSTSLILKDEVTLRLFFNLNGVNIDDVTFTYGEEELTASKRGSYYYVDITGIAAKDLGADVTVTVNDGIEEAYEITYNPMAYCYNVLNSGTSAEDLEDVVKALYLYHIEADKALGNR